MKNGRFTVAVIAVTAALAGALTSSVAARGSTTNCNSTYSNMTFHGGVVITKGDTCTLTNVVIDGGLTVSGGTFTVHNSLIHGSWVITGGTGVKTGRQCGDNVDGGLTVENTSGGYFVFGEANQHCLGGRINGGVRFVNNKNSAALELDGNSVNGGIVDTNNNDKFNEIEGNTVHGPATCAHNNKPVKGGNAKDGGPNSYTGPNNGCPA